MRRSFPTIAIVLLAAAALVAGVQVSRMLLEDERARPDIQSLLWPEPKALAGFELRDQHGEDFDRARLEGRWTFLFFGYTHCPDVCPVTLSVLDQVDERLAQHPEARAGTQYAFVSVDPARDTPEHLGQYVSYFDQRFLGVTGPAERLEQLTRQLGVLWQHHEPDENGDYLVDHTGAILLTDPRARLVGIFPLPHEAQAIAREFRAIRRFIESRG